MFNGTNLTLRPDADKDTCGKVTKVKKKKQENTAHNGAKRSALFQQVTTRLQGTDKTA